MINWFDSFKRLSGKNKSCYMENTYTDAKAVPTKQFFVSMLTRDISLIDAILDLVDNSLDGVLRLADSDAVDYSAHTIRVNCTDEGFRIKDNCGGIKRSIAAEYAFKFGREADDTRDSSKQTIGM